MLLGLLAKSKCKNPGEVNIKPENPPDDISRESRDDPLYYSDTEIAEQGSKRIIKNLDGDCPLWSLLIVEDAALNFSTKY